MHFYNFTAQHPEMTKPIKSLLTLVALAVAWMSGEPQSNHDLITIGFMVGGWIISVVAVAAVMRSDVSRLTKWQVIQEDRWQAHLQLHTEVMEVLAELKQMSKDTKDRMDRLDGRFGKRGK